MARVEPRIVRESGAPPESEGGGLGGRLRQLAAQADPRRLERDPLGLVRLARDREAAALVAAALAFGNARAIRASVGVAIRAFDGERGLLSTFRHRWVDGRDLGLLFDSIARCRDRRGGLEALFRAGDAGDLRSALDAFMTALRGRARRRGFLFLLPRPQEGSACKRPLLFLRWVVRPDDGADLGLWRSVDPARLLVPLDTHVFRIAYWLGLTERRAPSWKTAEEVTARLRRFDASDPVRFDFALAHMGILNDCPRRPVEAKCSRCPLRPWCRAWGAAPPDKSDSAPGARHLLTDLTPRLGRGTS